MNATPNYFEIGHKYNYNTHESSYFVDNKPIEKFSTNQMDFSITFTIFFQHDRILSTLSSENFCFHVMHEPPIPLYEQILIRPFDNRVWVFLLASIVICVFIWWGFKFLKDVDSPWQLLFATFGYFLGQSVKLRGFVYLAFSIIRFIIIFVEIT